MVHEVRNIMLSLDEVNTAFVCYQRITSDFLPNCTILECKSDGKGIVLTVEDATGPIPRTKEHAFQGLDVVKPLIRFCIENNIMLPRDGKKSVVFETDKVVLHVELNLSMDMPTTLSPMNMSHVGKMLDDGQAPKTLTLVSQR